MATAGVFTHSLVSWMSGVDKGKMSVIESSCVRGFEFMTIDKTGKPSDDDSVLVEWRAGKRLKSRDPWPLFDAKLIRSSSDKAALADELISISNSITDMERIQSGSEAEVQRKRQHIPSEKGRAFAKQMKCADPADDAPKSVKSVASKSVLAEKSDKQLLARIKEKSAMVPKNAVNNSDREYEALKKENEALKEENQKWRTMALQEIPGMILTMKQALEDRPLVTTTSQITRMSELLSPPKRQARKTSETSEMTSNEDQPATSATVTMGEMEENIELVPGVLCDKVAATKAKFASTPTQCARILLTGIFSMDILLESSLKGGANKRDTSATPKLPLDQLKLNAIYSVTSKKFPLATRSSIGVAISGKLTELRIAAKGKLEGARRTSTDGLATDMD